MNSRREFLRVAGAAGAYAMTRGATALNGQTRRREVTIGGRRVRVIDAHAHCVIPVPDVVKGTPLEKLGGGAGNNLLGPERLQIMDQQGVDVQALTINNFWYYAADADLARRIVLAQNEGKLLTHPAILRAIWGPAYGDESNYLHVYVSHLRRKIEPDPARPRYLLTQPGVGYRLVSS